MTKISTLRAFQRARVATAFLAVLFLLGACASTPPLRDEETTEPYASRVAKDRSLKSSRIRVRAEDPGKEPLKVSLRVILSPNGPSDEVLVLHPGILADGSTWRFITAMLAERFDLVVLDPPGTGKSDKPDPKTQGEDSYSPTWLARHGLRAVDSWQKSAGDDRPLVLLGHSLGSSVIIRMIADPTLDGEFGDIRRRINNPILISPVDVAIVRVPPVFRELVDLPGWQVGMGNTLGVLQSKIKKGVYRSVYDPDNRALEQEAERIIRMLRDGPTRRATQEMIRKFTSWADNRPDWDGIQVIEAYYGRVEIPVLILWGRRDETFSVSMGYKLAAQIPGARLVVVDKSMHSPHLERPDFVAEQVFEFLGAPASVSAGHGAGSRTASPTTFR